MHYYSVGVMLCFLNTPIGEAPPSKFLCVLNRFTAPLGFSMAYSALLVKLNRMYRIFAFKLAVKHMKAMKTKINPFKPALVDLRSQLGIISSFISVQLLLIIILIVYDTPEVMPMYPARKNDTLQRCAYGGSTLLISHIYPFFLMLICTYYAVKTRGIPENYKETKSIGFAMYSACILWLASVPLYFETKSSNFQIRIHIYSLAVSLNGFIILGCVFIPKMYILFCKSEENQQIELHIYGKETSKSTYENSVSAANQYIFSKCRSTNDDISAAMLSPTSNTSTQLPQGRNDGEVQKIVER